MGPDDNDVSVDSLTDEEMEAQEEARRRYFDQQEGEDLETRAGARHGEELEQYQAGHPAPVTTSTSTQLPGGVVPGSPQVLPDGPILRNMAEFKPVPVKWLWPGRIPLGKITMLAGNRGVGKSFLTIYMAARVSTGSPWPDGTECPRGSVILICGEDDPDDTIRPRLDVHHADVPRIELLTMVRRTDPKTRQQGEVTFTLADVENLRIALRDRPDCKLVVVDPIGSFLGEKVNEFRDNEVRSVLAPVAKLAKEYGPAVVIVAHHRKSKTGTADDLVMGSTAFTALARVVWHVGVDKDNEDRRLLLPGKNNLARKGSGLAFTIAGEPPMVDWERGPVTVTADEALIVDDNKEGGKKALTQLDQAKSFLKDVLADGPRKSAVVEELAKEEGISKRTLDRARAALGVLTDKQGVSDKGQWLMKLPSPVNHEPVVSKFQEVLHAVSTSGEAAKNANGP